MTKIYLVLFSSLFSCFFAVAVKANTQNHSLALLSTSNKIQSKQLDRPIEKFKLEQEKSNLSLAQNIKLTTQLAKQQQQPSVSIAAKIQERELSAIASPSASTDLTRVQTTAKYLTNELIAAKQNLLAQNHLLSNSLGEINKVSQLKDVSADDWTYEALRSLAERYNCITGFQDNTFRGQQTLTRYEFAAGLNSCLQQIEHLVGSSEKVAQDDLQTAQRLGQEFEAELSAIGERVDNLETRMDVLEDNQFSTTTIFNGEVIFGIADAFGGNPPGGCTLLPDGIDANKDPEVDCTNPTDPDTNLVLSNLTRLGLQTSFSGKDRLRLFLTTGNFGFGNENELGSGGGFTNARSLNTLMARLAYQADLNNEVFVDLLEYRFPVLNDRVVISAVPYGFSLSSVLTANSPYFDLGRGSISRFGQLSPIYRIGGAMDAGAGFDWLIADPVRLQFAYGTRGSGDPDRGLFESDHSALGAQLLFQPTENIVAGITYVNAYASDGVLGTSTGSVNAETGGLWRDFAIVSDLDDAPPSFECNEDKGFCKSPLGDQPAQINAVGGTLQWRLSEVLTFGAWGGYFVTNFLEELPDEPLLGDSAGKKPFANTASFALSLGLSDPFDREGDLLGFIFGMPPKLVDAGPKTDGWPVPFFEQTIANEDLTVVTDNNPNIVDGPSRVGFEDEATSLHFELFYRLKVIDNISITPGMFIVTNPGHIADNDTIYVGTIRTTFRF